MNFKSCFVILGLLALASGLFAQGVTFPQIPLPTSISASGQYDQIGTPKWTLDVDAWYPVSGQAGVYGTTGANVFPKLSTTPSGAKFYAVSANVQQGFHKSLFQTGPVTFLLGAAVGPNFSTANGSMNVNFSSSFIPTVIYQWKPAISWIVQVPGNYVSGAGWDISPRAGIQIVLGKLPPAKTQ